MNLSTITRLLCIKCLRHVSDVTIRELVYTSTLTLYAVFILGEEDTYTFEVYNHMGIQFLSMSLSMSFVCIPKNRSLRTLYILLETLF